MQAYTNQSPIIAFENGTHYTDTPLLIKQTRKPAKNTNTRELIKSKY